MSDLNNFHLKRSGGIAYTEVSYSYSIEEDVQCSMSDSPIYSNKYRYRYHTVENEVKESFPC